MNIINTMRLNVKFFFSKIKNLIEKVDIILYNESDKR